MFFVFWGTEIVVNEYNLRRLWGAILINLGKLIFSIYTFPSKALPPYFHNPERHIKFPFVRKIKNQCTVSRI